jgi:valyl-tRNA synthetase
VEALFMSIDIATVAKSWDPKEVEPKWIKEWESKGYFKADPLSTKPPFSIVLPPPNVTGSLHLGHALTATIQDMLIRYKRMNGFNCLWLPGTDHAGIATQMVVEKELQKTEKKSRHDLGRENFLKRVWAWKEKYGARIGEQHKVMGASLDWSRERFTMDAGVSEAVKETFVTLHEQGLMYRAQKLINWDPVLHTALSDLEVDNEDRDGFLWSIAYPVKGSDEKLVVATTRPETMLGDTAVAVHPEDVRYKHLIGKTVVLPLVNREIPIIADGILVNMEFGTGVVKVTPAHDHNDYATGQRNKLPSINIFDISAKVNENGGRFQGLDRFEARKQIIEELKVLELMVEEKPYKVPMALSQRSGVPVEPRLSWQWYVNVKPLAEKAIAAVEQGKTKFVPENWTQTYFNWMRNIHDWCVSRQLWWGHQIPAWYPVKADGSVDFEDPKPVVSREKPAGNYVQDPDVLDTWFSSALWPFSTLGWPNKNAPDLKTFYPNSVMETGHDIIFFWVARMMMMGIHLMGEVPFKVVYLHAMVRDEKGEKMSKTKGNVIDPLDIIQGAEAKNLPASVKNKFPQGLDPQGSDALRFTLASLTQQGRDIKLSVERIVGYKAFCNKLWNATRFGLMHGVTYQHDSSKFITERNLSLPDRWILSRLNEVTKQATAAFENYQFSEACSALYQFTWGELCDWYIELSKGTLGPLHRESDDPTAPPPPKVEIDEAQKAVSLATLFFCLEQLMRLIHPVMPFISEEIWSLLPIPRDVKSLSISTWPQSDARLENKKAEAELAPIISVIDAIRSVRGESNISPALKLVATVQTSNAVTLDILKRGQHFLISLARLEGITISPLGEKPKACAAEMRGELEIFVSLEGIVDLKTEVERLKKEIEKAKKEIGQIEKKFENPNYAARAPADVVKNDKERIVDLNSRIAKLTSGIERLS